ncbi:Putative isomerase YbhE [Glarea lozoyensis ATCC 20868]|uniref:Putative isomerase YbhE n=1 Tax=Glarea lozoyensis (strain ATCC 20868 / MF5171) TaxID=1116229 RepID=S3D6N2_GLAL2|nr:Putative isomerase YbhE [Glarea lozoyensis ATCC 20868]EPE33420.1 Putative isomerase YbhE [Glarea lozoyensis ATCC 20868]
MAKRKRTVLLESKPATTPAPTKKIKPSTPTPPQSPTTIQIIAGSYDRVLHGLTATISPTNTVEFADTFLFNAHTTAIRCLALSPPSLPVPKQPQKVILASGSTDERINLYHISAHAPSYVTVPAIAGLSSAVVENPQNKELGSLLHHSSSVTALYFPNRSKLLSSAEDNTIAVTRTRDWSLLSAIKVPVPKAVGRPSGDTAPLGGAPAGVNDFAVHPSMKLMISVGKGERSMRLWNLVTGKKAGVLNFERDILNEVGESKFTSGEGRKVAWGATDAGEEFCVGFDKGAVVYGMDSKPKCKVVPKPRNTKQKWVKVHQMCYLQVDEEKDIQILAVSTEDGRILFYSTRPDDLEAAASEKSLPAAKLIAILDADISPPDPKSTTDSASTRIKDFTILPLPNKTFIIPTARSDGTIQIFSVSPEDLLPSSVSEPKTVGKSLGSIKTGNRITCLKAFVMLPKYQGEEGEDGDEFEGFGDDVVDEEVGSSGSDSESSDEE